MPADFSHGALLRLACTPNAWSGCRHVTAALARALGSRLQTRSGIRINGATRCAAARRLRHSRRPKLRCTTKGTSWAQPRRASNLNFMIVDMRQHQSQVTRVDNAPQTGQFPKYSGSVSGAPPGSKACAHSSSVALQLTASPFGVFARGIEHELNVAIAHPKVSLGCIEACAAQCGGLKRRSSSERSSCTSQVASDRRGQTNPGLRTHCRSVACSRACRAWSRQALAQRIHQVDEVAGIGAASRPCGPALP